MLCLNSHPTRTRRFRRRRFRKFPWHSGTDRMKWTTPRCRESTSLPLIGKQWLRSPRWPPCKTLQTSDVPKRKLCSPHLEKRIKLLSRPEPQADPIFLDRKSATLGKAECFVAGRSLHPDDLHS